jgi:CubicO group peptidase (beta-lactamase class C family)
MINQNPNILGFLPDRLDRIGAHIQSKYLDTGLLPFGALLVGRGDEIAYQWQSGVPDDAIYRIASMTKPITSVAFMQLVEQGKVALSDPVSKYIPEFTDTGVFVAGGGNIPFVTRPAIAPMRIIDLLRHTSGLSYSFQERTAIDTAYRKTDIESWSKWDQDEFIAGLAQIPLQFDPGQGWNYSVSTDVLGVIISRISGMALGDFLSANIFEPLAMKDTHFKVPQEKASRVPDSYVWHPIKKMTPGDPGDKDSAWVRGFKIQSGGGGLASSLGDYHRFCRMLLNGGALDGVQIVSPKTLDLMTRNHLPGGGDLTQHSTAMFSEADNAGVGFGLGFAVTMDPALTLVPGSAGEYFWGGMYSTAFFVDPAEDICMVFMTQLMPSSTYPIRRELRTLIYSALAA